MRIVKTALNVVSVMMMIAGLVWALQGAGILPGSFMSGQPFWLIAGIITGAVGAGILYFANRRGGDGQPTG